MAASLVLAQELSALVEVPDLFQVRHAAQFAVGQLRLLMGDFESAQSAFTDAVESYDRAGAGAMALPYQEDVKASSKGFNSWALWNRGYPDQAAAAAEHSIAYARQQNHAFSRTIACCVAGHGRLLRRDVQLVRELSEEGLALCREQGFPWYDGWLAIQLGWADAQSGQTLDAIPGIRAGLKAFYTDGAEMLVPWALSVLAEALGKAGQLDEAQANIDEALAIATKNGEHIHLAEILRLKGELMRLAWNGGHSIEAEDCFRRAIEVARSQKAKSWELRAAMSLARLLQAQGREPEARALLKPVYGWFTEGFDTPDLRDAAALLAALN